MDKARANRFGYLVLTSATGELVLVKASMIMAMIEDGDITSIWVGNEEPIFVNQAPETILEQLDNICPNML